MAQPYRRKDNTGHPYALPCHHKEAEAHESVNLHYLSDADAEAANILTNMIDEEETHNIDVVLG